MNDLRTAAQQALEAWDGGDTEWFKRAYTVMEALRAALAEQRLTDMEQKMERSIESLKTALAEPEGGGNLPPPLQEPTVAENATTQQQLEDTPPSDYRRGYWDGFNIGKREGRIEAEDSLAEPVFEVGFGWLDDATKYPKGTKLYIAPPQRKPLTEEEIDSIWDSEKAFADIYAIARAIERAHGIV